MIIKEEKVMAESCSQRKRRLIHLNKKHKKIT